LYTLILIKEAAIDPQPARPPGGTVQGSSAAAPFAPSGQQRGRRATAHCSIPV